jgi:peptide/nickel transport system ATP-binding protein
MSGEPLLRVDHLSVAFRDGRRIVRAVEDVSFALADGRRLALLGESGSGKTVTARAIAGLLPEEARVSGSITWPALGRAPVAGRDIGFVFQDPMSSLNPVLTIGEQIGEVVETHLGLPRAQARARSLDLLRAVGIPEPDRRIAGYPHEFSGGQRQRIAVAIAIAAGPRLLIADEPTTALDTVVQAEIVDLIRRLTVERRMALVLITHDIALASGMVDDIAILYAGRLVETGPAAQVLRRPRHPYTHGLLRAGLAFDTVRRGRLAEIAGVLPVPGEVVTGCPFAPRCTEVMQPCREAFPAWTGSPAEGTACWLHVPEEEVKA